jgi:hypothetical protein
MRYIVYPTAQCRDDARHLGLTDEIDKLKSKVERDQSIANRDTFLPSSYVKKSMGNANRLVAAVRPVSDHIVICLLRIFVRNDDQCKHTSANIPDNPYLLPPTSYLLPTPLLCLHSGLVVLLCSLSVTFLLDSRGK